MIAIWIGAYVGIALAVADAISAGEDTAPQRDQLPWPAIAWVALVWLPVMIVGLVLVAHDAIQARPRRIGGPDRRRFASWRRSIAR